jgi:hypothetical protein
MTGWIVVIVIIILAALWPVSTRFGVKLFWPLSLIPAAWLALFYSFVVRAYLILGRWPQPYLPDPKDLGMDWHHVAIWLSFPIVAVGSMVFSLMVVRGRSQFLQGRYKWGVVFFGIAFVMWLIAMRTDPGHFLEWFVD